MLHSTVKAAAQIPQLKLRSYTAEDLLPFTHVDKGFKGDRNGGIRQNRWISRSEELDSWPSFNRDFFWASIATRVSERLCRKARLAQGKQPNSPRRRAP